MLTSVSDTAHGFLGSLKLLFNKGTSRQTVQRLADETNTIDEPHDRDKTIDHWICHRCFKRISVLRPPVFNEDDCSCVEVGRISQTDSQPTEPPVYKTPQISQSSTSSSSPRSFPILSPQEQEHDELNSKGLNTNSSTAPKTSNSNTSSRARIRDYLPSKSTSVSFSLISGNVLLTLLHLWQCQPDKINHERISLKSVIFGLCYWFLAPARSLIFGSKLKAVWFSTFP